MAEDLPPNLDDGELWLPSDVIRALGVCRHHRLAAGFSAIDDLSQKLASFGLLDHRRAFPTVNPSKDSSFYPEVRFPARQRVAGAAEWTGACFPDSRSAYKFHPVMSVDSHVERLRIARARVLQRQRQQNENGLNRFVPTRSAGSGRETGGTGVFLPRVYKVDSKKKPLSGKGSAQFQQSLWNPMLGKQAAKFLPSTEMSLPHDWTY